MERSTPEAGFLALPEITTEGRPRYLQLYYHLRDSIVSGRLKPGQRVPSSRVLAREIGLARGTVLLAYEQLSIEGYFETRTGAGTFVAEAIPEALQPIGGMPASTTITRDAPNRSTSRRIRRLIDGPDRRVMDANLFRPFQPGFAPLDVFPRATLARLASSIYRSIPMEDLGLSTGAGYEPLREALASYLRTTRGLTCTADQVIVTTGSQQAFLLASQVLLDEGDSVWMEDPGYAGARVAFAQAGLRIAPVPLDEEGLCVDVGEAVAPEARMAYVTPAHQYPSGVMMSLQRRLQLIQWASKSESWILEDDYDGEFRYHGQPLATLQSLDPHQRVIYVGSLSKVLAPALRVGYLIAPRDLIEPFTFAKAASDRHTPMLLQAVMARFIEEGHFGRHLRRIRTLCRERQDALLDAVHTHLRDRLEMHTDPAGLHMTGILCDGANDRTISDAAARKGVTAPAISNYCMRHSVPPALIFGYGGFTPDEIGQGIRRLADAMQ